MLKNTFSVRIDEGEDGIMLDLINRVIVSNPKYARGLRELVGEINSENPAAQLDMLLSFTKKGTVSRFFPEGI